MRMRGWGVVLVFWLAGLILGSQAFAASQALRLQQAAERRAARSLIVAEASRLGSAGLAAPDSVRRAVVHDGSSLLLESVRGPVDEAGGQQVRLRVMSPAGRRLQSHDVGIVAGSASQKRTAHAMAVDAAPVGGASVAGGSATLSSPVSHRPHAGAVPHVEPAALVPSVASH